MTELRTDRGRVGIFGGSFNPPHVAHLIVAEAIREQFDLDRILWIPNHRSPFKECRELADASDRLAMTQAATASNDRFVVSDVEIRRGGASYTIETIRTLQEAHPGTAYWLITGSDHLAAWHRWERAHEILERIPLIVFCRPGFEDATLPEGFEGHVERADVPFMDVSARDIRERIRSGRSFRYLVAEPVHAWIAARGLYVAAGPLNESI